MKEKLVIFKNEKGERLWGILTFPEEKGKYPGMIICHGFAATKSRRKYVELARTLAKVGISSLRFDFSGHGDSEGKIEDLSIEKQAEEINSAYQRLIRNPKIAREKIGILGHSLGALAAVLFQVKYRKAKALILVAPAIDQKNLIKKWYTKEQIRLWKKQGYLDTPKGRVGIKYLQDTEKDYLECLGRIDVPTLIIQGREDEDVPMEYTKEVFERLRYKKKLIIVENVEHHFESKKGIEALISNSLNWLKENL